MPASTDDQPPTAPTRCGSVAVSERRPQQTIGPRVGVAHVSRSPVLTADQTAPVVVGAVTAYGVVTLSDDEPGTSPLVLAPQQESAPAVEVAQVCASPVLTLLQVASVPT